MPAEHALDFEFLVPRAVEQRVQTLRGYVAHRRVKVKAVGVAQGLKVHGRNGGGAVHRPAGGFDRAFVERQVPVRDDQVGVHL